MAIRFNVRTRIGWIEEIVAVGEERPPETTTIDKSSVRWEEYETCN